MTTIISGSSPSITFSDSTTQTTAFTSTPSVTSITTSADSSISGLTVGKGAGAVSTNTAVGASALASNSTGAFNTATGYQALTSSVSGSHNTATGYGSLDFNTGSYNSAFGSAALNANTSGANNTAVGYYALVSNTTASNNTAVGYQAAYSGTTAANITAMGFQSLYNNTGDYNTGFGFYSLLSNTSGTNNSAFGPNALRANTTGAYNTSVGDGSLRFNTTASNNTAVGYQALYSSSTSSFNNAFGVTAGYSQTTGNSNCYFGDRSGYSNSTGSSNTFVGTYCGYSVTGSGNTFIGTNSGNAVTSGGKNSILGSYSGYQGGLDIRTASNYIVLSDGDGNPRSYIDNSANFFVNTTQAATAAQVYSHSTGGSINTGSLPFMMWGNTNNTSILHVRSSGSAYAQYATPLFLSVAATASSSNYLATFRSGWTTNTSYGDDEFVFRSDGNAYAGGTWNNNGADYAEYFESLNGQALTVGATVVLDGDKVRESTAQDPASAVMGVVRPKEPSKASMTIGNTAWNKWSNKYLTDDFDRYVMEDHDVVEWEETVVDEAGKESIKQHSYESQNMPSGIIVPANAVVKTHDDKGKKLQHYKLNPAWNSSAEYVNLENRPEWNIIGLIGQVKILKSQSMNDRWVKMRDVSASVEEWMIR
jgi:hypothetical protein